MKLRLKALLLALGLTVSSLSVCVYAEEETDASTEQVTEASEEESLASETDEEDLTEEESAAAEDAEDETAEATEDETETETAEAAEEDSEAVTEAAEEETETETEAMTAEEYYSQLIDNYLVQIDAWTDEQVDSYMESEDSVTALIAYNWNTVKSELGDYVGVTAITNAEASADGYGGTITATADYEGVGKGGTVTVALSYEYVYSSTYGQYVMSLTGLTWEVDYTLGVMMQKAAMNTAMGIVIVFCMLAFLSFLISKIHYIPEALEARKKGSEEPAAPAPKPAAAPAPVMEEPAEENPADDLELIAVITAAIAAAREEDSTVNTGDGYVVRSIKKVNNRNWRRA